MANSLKDRLAALVREPALLLDAFETFVVMAVALGLFDLHGDQQKILVGLFIALIGVTKGFLTKPFPVNVIPDFGRALLVFLSAFGLVQMSADQITLIVTFLGTIMTVMSRAQITPRYDPQGTPATEKGFMDVGWAALVAALGLVLAFSLQDLLLTFGLVAIVVVTLFVNSKVRPNVGRQERVQHRLRSFL